MINDFDYNEADAGSGSSGSGSSGSGSSENRGDRSGRSNPRGGHRGHSNHRSGSHHGGRPKEEDAKVRKAAEAALNADPAAEEKENRSARPQQRRDRPRNPQHSRPAQNAPRENGGNSGNGDNGRPAQNAQNSSARPSSGRSGGQRGEQRGEPKGEPRRPQQRRDRSASDAGLQKSLDDIFADRPAAPSIDEPLRRSRSFEALVDSMPPDPTLDAVFADPVPAEAAADTTTEIVGIRFAGNNKTYYFAPGDIAFRAGDHAIVETAQGVEFGEVAVPNRRVPNERIVQPLRTVIRIATPEDLAHNEDNHRREEEAFRICIEKIAYHKLAMKLVSAKYTFDNNKLIFYFTTTVGRVDFRELVKTLAGVFHTRIELRQINMRDEAKTIGGFGLCGRQLCCSTFLSSLNGVSLKMAKEQGLSLNSAKISGYCGRLMCCLRYEQETYAREYAILPPVNSTVNTPDGRGTILDVNPIGYLFKVRLEEKPDQPAKFYRLADIEVLTRGKSPAPEAEKPAEKPEN